MLNFLFLNIGTCSIFLCFQDPDLASCGERTDIQTPAADAPEDRVNRGEDADQLAGENDNIRHVHWTLLMQALCLYDYMKDYAGSSLFVLFKAIKFQVNLFAFFSWTYLNKLRGYLQMTPVRDVLKQLILADDGGISGI